MHKRVSNQLAPSGFGERLPRESSWNFTYSAECLKEADMRIMVGAVVTLM
jgi:hypothetical protein